MVEYAFLADFDLLRDARQDISQRPWATPAGRLAMDHYFKMCRAAEEVQRLNVEVRRVSTYLIDEDRYLRTCEEQVRVFNQPLAHQIGLYRCEHARFNAHHVRQLKEIAKIRGFSGSILPGESVSKGPGESASIPIIIPPAVVEIDKSVLADVVMEEQAPADTEEDLEEDEAAEDNAEEISRGVIAILEASHDP